MNQATEERETVISGLECLLFVSGEPLVLSDIARLLECSEAMAAQFLELLNNRLTSRSSGLQLISIAGGWQLSTRAEHADLIGKMLARSATRLSRAAIETVSIVAYRQPVTAPEIEAVRGVSSAGVLKTLTERGLITECGRKQVPGRPVLYVTTQDFLHYFGMQNLDDLPPLTPSDFSQRAAEFPTDTDFPHSAVSSEN